MPESMIPQDDSWIQEMDADNFLAILDVLMDIEQELNIASDDIEIPLLRTIVRFSQLLPTDAINMRDRYCELRWKAVGFIKKIGVVKDSSLIQGLHRWQSWLAIRMDGSNVARLKHLLPLMQEDYKRRLMRPKPSVVPTPADADDALQKVRLVLTRFHHVATRMRQRHDGRPTLDLADEYDIHDLLHALLVVFFDDVRLEEWTPSYAGKSSRGDFFLKPEGIVIEVKKTRPRLGEKEIGDQLIIDAERYRQMAGCKALLCFVYDPEDRISNPGGFQSDLSRTDEGFLVEVLVVPKRY